MKLEFTYNNKSFTYELESEAAIVKQIANIGRGGTLALDYIETVKIKKTPAMLEFFGDTSFNSNIAYDIENLYCSVSENDLQIINKGKCYNLVDYQNYIEINIVSKFSEFLNSLSELTLNDLVFDNHEIELSISNIDRLQTKSDEQIADIFYPIIFNNVKYIRSLFLNDNDIENYQFFITFYAIIQAIANTLNVTHNFVNETLFAINLLSKKATQSSIDAVNDIIWDFSGTSFPVSQPFIVGSLSTGDANFMQLYDIGATYNSAVFFAINDLSANLDVNINFSGATSANFEVYKRAYGDNLTNPFTSSDRIFSKVLTSGSLQTFTIDLNLNKGDAICFVLQDVALFNTLTVSTGTFEIKNYAPTFATYYQDIDLASSMQSISLQDVLKNILFATGKIMLYDSFSDSINFQSLTKLSENKNIGNVYDWSDYIDENSIITTYSIENIAKINTIDFNKEERAKSPIYSFFNSLGTSKKNQYFKFDFSLSDNRISALQSIVNADVLKFGDYNQNGNFRFSDLSETYLTELKKSDNFSISIAYSDIRGISFGTLTNPYIADNSEIESKIYQNNEVLINALMYPERLQLDAFIDLSIFNSIDFLKPIYLRQKAKFYMIEKAEYLNEKTKLTLLKLDL